MVSHKIMLTCWVLCFSHQSLRLW